MMALQFPDRARLFWHPRCSPHTARWEILGVLLPARTTQDADYRFCRHSGHGTYLTPTYCPVVRLFVSFRVTAI